MLAHLLHDVFIVGLVAVKLVESENHWLFQRLGCTEDVLCAYLHAILRVDQYDTGVGHIECGDRISDKVIGSGAVYHIKLLPKEFRIKNCREYAVAILFLNRERITYSVFSFNGAAAFYNSTLVKHSFGECGFTRAFAPKQGDVFNLVCLIDLHI